jgi:hypothetical protein
MHFSGILLLLFFQLTNLATAPDLPSKAGVYYRQNDGKWLNLKAALVAGAKTKGLGLYIETDGITGLQTEFDCQGAHASTQILLSKPVFYIRGIGSPSDAALVRFEQKKNRRLLHAAPSDGTAVNKGGFRKEAVRKIDIAQYPDKSFSITPLEDLKEGEYLLILGSLSTSFDFGIAAGAR